MEILRGYRKDLEFVKELYEPLVKKAIFFLDGYIYPKDIPVESYDLWEERKGIFTFTVSALYIGFFTGEELGHLLNDEEICRICQVRYFKLKQTIINEL